MLLSTRTSLHPTSAGRRRLSGAPGLITLVCALFFVSGLAQTAIVPLLPRISAADGLSTAAAALVLALPGLAMLTVSVPAGMLADRFGAGRITLGAGMLLVLGCAGQALHPLALLVGGRIVYGVSFGVLWTAGATWLSEIGHRPAGGGGSRVGQAVVCSSVGTMFGPALGGLLGTGGGHSTLAPFGVIAVAAALVTVAVAVAATRIGSVTGVPGPDARGVMRPRGAEQPQLTEPRQVADEHATATGARRVAGPTAGRGAGRRAGHRVAAHVSAPVGERPVAGAMGSLVVVGALSGVTQLLIARGLHAGGMSQGAIGLAFSACAVVYIATSSVFVRFGARACTLPINAVLTTLAALALVPALVSQQPVVLIAALMLTAAPRGAINVAGYGLAVGSGRGGGSVFGLLNGAWGAATVLAPIVAGALASSVGVDAAYLSTIAPSLAIALMLLVAARPRAARETVTGDTGDTGVVGVVRVVGTAVSARGRRAGLVRRHGRAGSRAVDDLQSA